MKTKILFPEMLVDTVISSGSFVKSKKHNVEGFIGEILRSFNGPKEYILTSGDEVYFCQRQDLEIIPMRIN